MHVMRTGYEESYVVSYNSVPVRVNTKKHDRDWNFSTHIPIENI